MEGVSVVYSEDGFAGKSSSVNLPTYCTDLEV